ncbi:chemotaxis protein CheD [Dechloromonas sp. HYN0024]|uniref:chemotaxis protein CheD n=1 Tax=Dechloromonas sp. HYN0024 TaxID=2231055 RepID=UPI000E43E465|nr:chemotaxis protein CheD [Dechloromonas sp. HYN0024]AXS79355.1 chemotaxis protein CheD [Dechloromonas sp. HYN0024]
MDYSKLSTQEIERLARTIHPGAWAIEPDRPLATLLGSCVAVCLFDPQARVGGLNHFMLPSIRRSSNDDIDSLLSGAYAMESLLNGLLQKGAKKVRLQAKAFGGGTIINTSGPLMSIGSRNADFTKEWLNREGIPLLASDFLGPWSRKVLFVPTTGDAFCRRMVTNMATAEVIAREEKSYAETLVQKPKTSEKKIELF